MKRLLALLMCLMLVLSGTALAQEGSDDTLVVGSTTRLSGDFFAGLWSNNTVDVDVRVLLHDGATVSWTEVANYAINSNVILETENKEAQGHHTYQFKLRQDMQFSDGSPITAKDYVFSVLLLSSAQLAELGANNATYAHLLGWEEYSSGRAAFAGVRLLGEDTFSLTIDGEYLPYFYELSMLRVVPYPLAVLAPGCDVKDDGEGAYLTDNFSAELLKTTLLDETTGYLSHPAVVSGPYTLDDYDAETGIARFTKNPYYMGDYAGQKPAISHLVLREVKNDTLMAELADGTVGLVNKVSSGEVITEGRARLSKGLLGSVSYLRSGLSFVAFACEAGHTASVKVRQAVNRVLDPAALCDTFLRGYGEPTFAYYGYGQWMAAQQKDALTSLNLYEKDLEAALELLIQDGWTLDAAGEAYDADSTGLRHRQGEAGLEPLTLKMAIPQQNAAAQAVVAQLDQGFAQLGVGLEVTELPMNQLLRHYYRQAERTYDLFFLASNFNFIFDPYYTYHTADEYQGVFNTSGLRDEKLMELAKEMRQVAPEDTEGYKEKWLLFQNYWVQVLPLAPLYSNLYFDFYTPALQNYNISSYSTWASAILYATLGE